MRATGLNKDDNFYAVLGVDREATRAEIRDAYRRRMQQADAHPDRGGDTQLAALINKAYAVLSNPAHRRDYNARLDVLDLVARRRAAGSAFEAAKATPDTCPFCLQPTTYGTVDRPVESCASCGSVLNSVETLPLGQSGKRAVPRFGRSLDLTVYTQRKQRQGLVARTEDFSPHGVRMTVQGKLRPGQRVRLVSDVFEAVGEVAHCARGCSRWRGPTTVGIAFLTLRFTRPVGVFASCRI